MRNVFFKLLEKGNNMFLKSNNFSSSHQKQQRIENTSLISHGINLPSAV